MPEAWIAPVACPDCGTLRPEWEALLAEKDEAVYELGLQVASLRATNRKLRSNGQGQVEADPHYADAVAVFEYWKAKLAPRAREFNGGRLDKVLARLRGGATVDEMKAAIDGAAAKPYVTDNGRSASGLKSQRYVELGDHICKNEGNLLRFQGYAEPVTANGAGPAASSGPAPKEVTRLRDRVERLEKEKRELQDRVAEQEQAAVNWRASFHEALDYLSICNKSLAITADDSNTQRFTVATA